MSYDTAVERNVYWFGDRKIVLEPGDDLAQQVAEEIMERLRADEQSTVHADSGADGFDVVVSVKLVPRRAVSTPASSSSRKCYDKSCSETAAVRVRGMLGGDIDPHDYCLRHAAQYCAVSEALGVAARAEPIL